MLVLDTMVVSDIYRIYATINFSLAGVRLLIEGGSWLLFIYLCADLVVSYCDRLVFQDYFRIVEIL